MGYGDIAPITPLGKFIGSLVAMSAIGVFGLPGGVLASGFIEEWTQRDAHDGLGAQSDPRDEEE